MISKNKTPDTFTRYFRGKKLSRVQKKHLEPTCFINYV